jgi:FAD/FMN-containing dehydrogenase
MAADLEALRAGLAAIVGEANVLTGGDAAPYARDWRGLYDGRTPAVVRPGTTEQVAEIVRLCAQHRAAIVPQGGNTSMVAGATPRPDGEDIVLSLSRLNRIRGVDGEDMSMVAEAGVPWRAAQDAAAEAGCLLPLSISSEGSAQVGGILSANAGGNNTVRYGNARELVLGLEAVLPDGQVWHGLRRLRKDNTGYALRQLLVGAEGTLGIITAAVLKLVPRPTEVQVALCSMRDVASACTLFRRVQAADAASVQAFEYMSGEGMRLVLRHIPGTKLPLSVPGEHYALMELASTRPGTGLRDTMEAVLEQALSDGLVEDAALAESDAQRQAMWRLREEHAEAQKREGASVKNDVSVPVSRVPELIDRASAAVRRLIPGVRPVPFGHLGDGNIHMNLEQPPDMDAAAFLARDHEIMDAVNDVVRDLDGSFSAEHGVGLLKPYMMEQWRGGPELEAMRRIKAALDPQGLMNPGKMLP